jgi:hypothetical protein
MAPTRSGLVAAACVRGCDQSLKQTGTYADRRRSRELATISASMSKVSIGMALATVAIIIALLFPGVTASPASGSEAPIPLFAIGAVHH